MDDIDSTSKSLSITHSFAAPNEYNIIHINYMWYIIQIRSWLWYNNILGYRYSTTTAVNYIIQCPFGVQFHSLFISIYIYILLYTHLGLMYWRSISSNITWHNHNPEAFSRQKLLALTLSALNPVKPQKLHCEASRNTWGSSNDPK